MKSVINISCCNLIIFKSIDHRFKRLSQTSQPAAFSFAFSFKTKSYYMNMRIILEKKTNDFSALLIKLDYCHFIYSKYSFSSVLGRCCCSPPPSVAGTIFFSVESVLHTENIINVRSQCRLKRNDFFCLWFRWRIDPVAKPIRTGKYVRSLQAEQPRTVHQMNVV